MLKNISTIISEKGKKASADTCRNPNLLCKIVDYAPSAKSVFPCPVPVAKQDDQPRPLPVRETRTLCCGRYRDTFCPYGLHPAQSKRFQGRFLIFKNISSDSTHSETTKTGAWPKSLTESVQILYIIMNTTTYKPDKLMLTQIYGLVKSRSGRAWRLCCNVILRRQPKNLLIVTGMIRFFALLRMTSDNILQMMTRPRRLRVPDFNSLSP